jgi:hypothetical protein
MDKTLEIVLVATVLIMTAVSLMFMFSGKGTQFNNWMNDTQGQADCSLLQTRYQQACACGESPNDPEPAPSIHSEAQNDLDCDWATGSASEPAYTCNDYCS